TVLLRLDPVQTRAEADAAAAQVMTAQAESGQQQMQINNAENNYERDKVSLLAAKAELEQARVQTIRAKGTYLRKQQLHEENLVAREEYDLAKADWNATQAALEAAQARVNQIEISLKNSLLQIQQMREMHKAALSRMTSAKATQTRAMDLFRKTTI